MVPDINTAGTLTNVAYQNQSNTFTAAQTISSGVTIQGGVPDVTGGLNNNSGGITNTGAISGATSITATGTEILSGATPLTKTNGTPTISLEYLEQIVVLTITDAEFSPNTLLTLTDAGTTRNLSCNCNNKCKRCNTLMVPILILLVLSLMSHIKIMQIPLLLLKLSLVEANSLFWWSRYNRGYK